MIEINGVTKKFDDKEIFHNLNLTIEENELVAIGGQSGSGKSTLLNMIGLLDSNFEGEIVLAGTSIKNLSEKKKRSFIRENVSYLFQNYALIDEISVEQNLLLALEYDRLTKEDKLKKIDEVLSMVNLEGYNQKKVYTLSGGEQQRVALARTLLKKSTIILADEFTGNLDEGNSQHVMNIIKTLRNYGKTIVIVTHDEKISSQCDYSLMIEAQNLSRV